MRVVEQKRERDGLHLLREPRVYSAVSARLFLLLFTAHVLFTRFCRGVETKILIRLVCFAFARVLLEHGFAEYLILKSAASQHLREIFPTLRPWPPVLLLVVLAFKYSIFF